MQKFQMLNYNEVTMKKHNDYETTFMIQPLERGFANTMGNAIRRVLLSSISGVAPFAVKVQGAQHEFEALSGVKETLVQLILNLKRVRFFYNRELFKDGEIVKVTLQSDKGKVSAKDFELPTGIQIVNPDEYIATLAKNGSLKLEMFLVAGRGYISFDENKNFIKQVSNKIESKIELGTLIAVDSDFSPVEKVYFDVVELNTSSAIIQEKLLIHIKTDKSVEAKDAIAESAQILKAHFDVMSNVSNLEKQEVFVNQEELLKKPVTKDFPIGQLELSVRSYNSLRRAGYTTLSDLANLTVQELSETRNLGAKSLEEILEKLIEKNIKLKEGDK